MHLSAICSTAKGKLHNYSAPNTYSVFLDSVHTYYSHLAADALEE